MSVLRNIENILVHLILKQKKFRNERVKSFHYYEGQIKQRPELKQQLEKTEKEIEQFKRYGEEFHTILKVVDHISHMLHHKVPEKYEDEFKHLYHVLNQCRYDIRHLPEAHACAARIYEEIKADILKFAQENLAKYKIPKIIEISDNLPLTVIGKIDKKSLRKM